MRPRSGGIVFAFDGVHLWIRLDLAAICCHVHHFVPFLGLVGADLAGFYRAIVKVEVVQLMVASCFVQIRGCGALNGALIVFEAMLGSTCTVLYRSWGWWELTEPASIASSYKSTWVSWWWLFVSFKSAAVVLNGGLSPYKVSRLPENP